MAFTSGTDEDVDRMAALAVKLMAWLKAEAKDRMDALAALSMANTMLGALPLEYEQGESGATAQSGQAAAHVP
jgi:hypothetical protein